MRTYPRRLLIGASFCIFMYIIISLYNALETRSHDRTIYQDREDELKGLEGKVKKLEDEVSDSGVFLSGMLHRLRQEREEMDNLEVFAKKKADADGAFLQAPKQQDQLENEERNAAEAAELRDEDKQAVQGVIHPPEDGVKRMKKVKDHERHMIEDVDQDKMKGVLNPPDPRSEKKAIGGKLSVVRKFLQRALPFNISLPDDICAISSSMLRPSSDISMLNVYEMLPFDDPDGGVWKQGFDIQYDSTNVLNEKRLEVIVVPHSHTDPGWKNTFEEYYRSQAKFILDNMVKNLKAMKKMHFIYAEMSFFELWWAEIDEQTRSDVKELLLLGKLELVTGAWVMTDEANSHYFATISQMIEGHEWIKNHIGTFYKPTSHWSIDPFGLSPTISYFMKKSNFSNGVLQRVHYSVKKYLADAKQLEFAWRQLWGAENNVNDFTTHVMPFFSYDVPHTCGPDPKICCQFDFKRLPGGDLTCPWNIQPVEIAAGNVEERSKVLYDQYRKKAQLYRTNVLLVPLGDDFRYETDFEWEKQYENYEKLFIFMNAKRGWNIHARFGTLRDYFAKVHQRLDDQQMKLPVLSGDFFTYADRNDHYWSGYYTSRPLYKRLDRILQHYLRSAEFLYSFVTAKNFGAAGGSEHFGKLVDARRYMSLFQHHDGITGTSRAEVMMDYGRKMFIALKNCEQIITRSIQLLLNRVEDLNSDLVRSRLNMEQNWEAHDILPTKIVTEVGSELVIFNSLAQQRHEVVCLRTTSKDLVIEKSSAGGSKIMQQVNPLIKLRKGKLSVSSDEYELCFEAEIPALGFKKYLVKAGKSTFITASVYNSGGMDFKLKNKYVDAEFDGKTGMLSAFSLTDYKKVLINAEFVKYDARLKSEVPIAGTNDPPGAYLFLPNGPATVLKAQNHYGVIDGPVMKKVMVVGRRTIELVHTATITSISNYITLENVVNIEKTSNFELAMRLKTSVESGDQVFTDLNGYQMIKRRRFEHLPLQAHFYPMPGSAFIEDSSTRISLLGAQPVGVASLKSGWLEVMLDRRLNQDDGRGLLAGIEDNKRTSSVFRLMVEPLEASDLLADEAKSQITSYHSLAAHFASLDLLYPPMILISDKTEYSGEVNEFTYLVDSFPCDVHPVTLRTLSAATMYGENSSRIHLPLSSQALVLHRFAFDCRSKLQLLPEVKCNVGSELKLTDLFHEKPTKIVNTSLTLLYDYTDVNTIEMEPMEIRTVRMDYLS